MMVKMMVITIVMVVVFLMMMMMRSIMKRMSQTDPAGVGLMLRMYHINGKLLGNNSKLWSFGLEGHNKNIFAALKKV